MSRDQLFAFMARHRVQLSGCSRCGGRSVVYFMDAAERPVCYGCIFTARDWAERLEDAKPEAGCGHPVNFIGCDECVDRQLRVHAWHTAGFVPSCWFCDADQMEDAA